MGILNSDTIYTIVIITIVVIIALFLVLKSPFHFPYFTYDFDVSRKRNPQIEDLIDKFLIDGNFYMIQKHTERIFLWKQECQDLIQKSKIKKFREKQFYDCLEGENAAFRFYLTREQTRYRQQNYVKMAYKVTQTINKFCCDYTYLQNRNKVNVKSPAFH